GPWVSGHIQNWLKNNKKFDCLVLTCHDYGGVKTGKYNVKSCFLFNRWISFLIFPFFLAYYYAIYRPHLVHVHFLSSYGILSSFLPGKKILSLWGTDINGKVTKNKFFRRAACSAMRKYTIINSPALHMTKKINSWGVEQNKIKTFQYGIDTNKLDKILDKKVIVNKDVITVASIRNWDSLYQIEQLLNIWEKFECEKFQLKLFGKSHNLEIEKRITNICSKMDNVEIVGFVSQDEFYSSLLSCDVFVSLPVMDGTPLSVIESIYLGLSPVVTDLPFYTTDFKLENQYIVPAKFSYESLHKSILESYKNWTSSDVHRFRSLIRCKFSIEKNTDRMFSLYEELIEGNKSE
ncbi:glycosyltransferase, partial [Vibrio alginolyticus]|nr:glycosyltransferase [Vibrio alginolyticus]